MWKKNKFIKNSKVKRKYNKYQTSRIVNLLNDIKFGQMYRKQNLEIIQHNKRENSVYRKLFRRNYFYKLKFINVQTKNLQKKNIIYKQELTKNKNIILFFLYKTGTNNKLIKALGHFRNLKYRKNNTLSFLHTRNLPQSLGYFTKNYMKESNFRWIDFLLLKKKKWLYWWFLNSKNRFLKFSPRWERSRPTTIRSHTKMLFVNKNKKFYPWFFKKFLRKKKKIIRKRIRNILFTQNILNKNINWKNEISLL